MLDVNGWGMEVWWVAIAAKSIRHGDVQFDRNFICFLFLSSRWLILFINDCTNYLLSIAR